MLGRVIVASANVGLAAAIVAAAPSRLGEQALSPQFRSRVDVVEVYATVRLTGGDIVRGLTRQDFELRIDGKRREITVFAKALRPLSVAMVLDRSWSTDLEFGDVREGALSFLTQLVPGDRASINTLTWNCGSFTGDSNELRALLQMHLPLDWGSPIWAAADRAMTSLASEAGRPVVLLFSDGRDTQEPLPKGVTPTRPVNEMVGRCTFADPGPNRSAIDIARRAERDEITLYSVSIAPKSARPELPGDLARIASQSGGAYHRLSTREEFRSVVQNIADELHEQYLLGFTPDRDGKPHNISVHVNRSGTQVQARKIYVAR